MLKRKTRNHATKVPARELLAVLPKLELEKRQLSRQLYALSPSTAASIGRYRISRENSGLSPLWPSVIVKSRMTPVSTARTMWIFRKSFFEFFLRMRMSNHLLLEERLNPELSMATVIPCRRSLEVTFLRIRRMYGSDILTIPRWRTEWVGSFST